MEKYGTLVVLLLAWFANTEQSHNQSRKLADTVKNY